MANWYVKRGSETAGPLTQDRIKELAAQGKIEETDLIRKGEQGDFFPAGQIPGLLPDPESESPPTPQAPSSPANTPPARKKKHSSLPILLCIGFLAGVSFLFILYEAWNRSHQAALRETSYNRLRQMGLAIHNYHDRFRHFPPGGTLRDDGTPMHSWQTAILPELGLEQSRLYDQIDQDQPWSSPQNQQVFRYQVSQYLNPAISETATPDGLGLSHYVGNELLLKKKTPLRFRDVTDSAANTIMALEAGENFKAWGDPGNIAKPHEILGPSQKKSFKGGTHVLMLDGSVRFISENTDPEILRSLSTPDGNERIWDY